MKHVFLALLLCLTVVWIAPVYAEDAPAARPDAPAFDTPPAPLSAISPTYPAAAKEDGLEGKVLLEVVIGADGSTKRVRVAQGVRADLDAAALAAVKTLRWSPAKAKGQAVDATVIVPIQFKLADKKTGSRP